MKFVDWDVAEDKVAKHIILLINLIKCQLYVVTFHHGWWSQDVRRSSSVYPLFGGTVLVF